MTRSTSVCERAAILEPAVLRSLDALHLAAALEIGDELEGMVTYDRRLADGAEALGVSVVAAHVMGAMAETAYLGRAYRRLA